MLTHSETLRLLPSGRPRPVKPTFVCANASVQLPRVRATRVMRAARRRTRAAIASYSWLALAPATLRESFGGALEHAEHHPALIGRFWRFPHRNRLLRRENTPAPKTWLRESGVRFGQ